MIDRLLCVAKNLNRILHAGAVERPLEQETLVRFFCDDHDQIFPRIHATTALWTPVLWLAPVSSPAPRPFLPAPGTTSASTFFRLHAPYCCGDLIGKWVATLIF